MRTCRKCGETKPITEFDFRADTMKYRTSCKACRRKYQTAPSVPLTPRARWFVGTTELLPCHRCGIAKPWTEFPRRGGNSERLQTWCRACFSAYKAERHQLNHEREMKRIRRNHKVRVAANRERILEYLLAHPCVDCGQADSRVLDFDHVRGVKIDDVSQMVLRGLSWVVIAAEIEKCEVRCANCHRLITIKRREDRRAVSEPDWTYGEPGGARSLDLHIRSVPLYPTELRAHV